MATKFDDEAKVARHTSDESSPPPPTYGAGSVQEDNAYVYDDSQKLGYTATVFVILNKMIGTGSMYRRRIESGSCLLEQQSFPLHLVSLQLLDLSV
jgi:hypothetical protein